MAKRRVLYGLILLTAGSLYLFLADYLSYYLLLFFFCLPLCSLLVLLLNGRKLSLKLQPADTPVQKGETLPISLFLSGNFRFYRPVLRCRLSIEHRKTGERTRFWQKLSGEQDGLCLSLSVTPAYSGVVRISLEKASLIDPLGLFSLPVKLSATEREDLVLPQISLLPIRADREISALLDSDLFSSHKPGDDPAQVFDIRPYRAGDRLSRLHVKLTAKFDDPMIREMSEPIAIGTLILLEPNSSAAENDCLFDLAASLAFTLLSQQDRLQLCWFDPDRNREDSALLLEEKDFSAGLFSFLTASAPTGKTPLLSQLEGTVLPRRYNRILYLCGSAAAASPELLRRCFPQDDLFLLSVSPLSPELRDLCVSLDIHPEKNPLQEGGVSYDQELL